MIFFLLALGFSSGVLVQAKTKLGDIIPLCNLNDVNVEDCLKTSSQNILPILAKGVRDWYLKGLDPILIPTIIMGQDTGPISIRWEHMNSTITGLSKVKFNEARISKKENTYYFVFNITAYNLTFVGDFKARGRMFFLPIKNEGYEEIYTYLSNLTITFQAQPKSTNKVEYLTLKNFQFTTEIPRDVKISVESSNKKSTWMDKILTKFLTDNGHEIVKEMKPTLEAAYGGLIQSYIQKFLEKIPLKELFKE